MAGLGQFKVALLQGVVGDEVARRVGDGVPLGLDGFGRALAPNGAGDSLPVTGVSRLAEAIDRIGQQRWTTP